MRKTQVLNLVLRGMNLVIAVLEITLDDKRTRIPILGGTGMITTRIPALGQHVRDVAIAVDDLLDELGEARVDKVGDDADRLGEPGLERLVHVARHVLLDHGADVAGRVALSVRLEERLRAKQAALLGGVPVELECVGMVAVDDRIIFQDRGERFEDGDGAGAVVVGARGGEDGGQEQVDAVLVRADHDRFVRAAGEARDDAELAPGVRELFDECAVVVCA